MTAHHSKGRPILYYHSELLAKEIHWTIQPHDTVTSKTLSLMFSCLKATATGSLLMLGVGCRVEMLLFLTLLQNLQVPAGWQFWSRPGIPGEMLRVMWIWRLFLNPNLFLNPDFLNPNPNLLLNLNLYLRIQTFWIHGISGNRRGFSNHRFFFPSL
jgi:hypothetical protein